MTKSTPAVALEFPPDPAVKSSTGEGRSTGFYAPALDGLRCLAVFGVLFAHFSPTLSGIANWGQWGVRLFFVLSGFLITRLLLETRLKVEAGRLAGRSAVRSFFIRRVFRLWPVYFLCLAIACILNIEVTRQTIWWHVLMVSNQYVFQTQSWPGMLSHFWTLAVEQQFYLFWPFLILFVPKRSLNPVLLAVLIAGPLTRGIIIAMNWGEPLTLYTLLPCCLDFFAIGGAVAWGHQSGWLDRFATSFRLRLLLVPTVCWLLLGSVLTFKSAVFPRYWLVYDPLLQALGFAVLIVYLLRRPDGRTCRLLSLRPLVYIGEISYGLYIVHNFMHWLGPGLLRHLFGFAYFSRELPHVLYYIALALIIAAASHRFFEEPVRRFGRRLA